jgi:hypothetical protein
MPIFDDYTIIIDKEGIKGGDYSVIRDYMSEFDFNETLIYENKSQLHISIYGYDDDPRELFEIEEVVEWVKKSIFEEEIPWFLLLSTSPDSQSIKLLALCFCSDPAHGIKADASKLQEFAEINFGILNKYMKEKKLLDSQNAEISQNIIKYFHNWLDKK